MKYTILELHQEGETFWSHQSGRKICSFGKNSTSSTQGVNTKFSYSSSKKDKKEIKHQKEPTHTKSLVSFWWRIFQTDLKDNNKKINHCINPLVLMMLVKDLKSCSQQEIETIAQCKHSHIPSCYWNCIAVYLIASEAQAVEEINSDCQWDLFTQNQENTYFIWYKCKYYPHYHLT